MEFFVAAAPVYSHNIFTIEKKPALEINVEAGKQYFIHCEATKASPGIVPGQVTLTIGGWSGIVLHITDDAAGKMEFLVTKQAKNKSEEEDK